MSIAPGAARSNSNARTARASSPPQATTPVVVVLAAWLALVIFCAARGAFVGSPGTPPLALLVSFLTPIIAFFAAYRLSGGFRAFVLSCDLRLVVGIQAWRFAGLGFIALAAHGVLPAPFAWQAGLGDLAIGITAPWVVLALIRQPRFASHPLFLIWNLLGILDLVAAIANGALSSLLAPGSTGVTTTMPMAQLPLVLVPAYLVPVFLMLHLTALFQMRQRQAAENSVATTRTNG